MEERDLRFWFGNTYRGVKFIEPTFGSSVGLPDTEVTVDKKVLPIELKIGSLRGANLIVNLRPSQMRYHIMEAEQNCPTAVMAAVGERTKFDVMIFAGKYLESGDYRDSYFIVAEDMRFDQKIDELRLTEAFRLVMGQYA